MARPSSIDDSKLTKMELRKLNALRKSVGERIAAKVFKEWYRARPVPASADQQTDKTGATIAEAVESLIKSKKIKSLPRRGYVIKRGRGRVMIEQVR